MVPHRDLGDARLWHASDHRSRERRRATAARGAITLPSRAATASVAVALGAVALPAALHAAPASAASGLAAVQEALGVTADGVMGPQTRSALRRFQREHGLAVDGRAGAPTRAALGVSSAAEQAAAKVTGTLRDVQAKLGLDADGIAGPKTRAAIRAFQSAHDLEATGRLDRKTRAAILGSEGAGATIRSVSTGATDQADAAPAAAEGVGAAVDAARAQIGKPYPSGGKGPGGFDCSGLTAFAFRGGHQPRREQLRPVRPGHEHLEARDPGRRPRVLQLQRLGRVARRRGHRPDDDDLRHHRTA